MVILGSCLELSSATSPIKPPEDAWLQHRAAKTIATNRDLMPPSLTGPVIPARSGGPNNAIPRGRRRVASDRLGVAMLARRPVHKGSRVQASEALRLR